MLKKRIIPCLDVMNGQTVKGVRFENMRQAGDPVELAKRYVQQGADELVFLDITATREQRGTMITLVEKLSAELNIPFTVGGGISTIADVRTLLQAGADKVSVNSAAVIRPELLSELASEFGSQCIIAAIDTRSTGDDDYVYVRGGTEKTVLRTLDYVQMVTEAGAGEILLTSMDADGTKKGFDLKLLKKVCSCTLLPVIASGGAGSMEDFKNVLLETEATGALAASVFHFGEIEIPALKLYLKENQIPVR